MCIYIGFSNVSYNKKNLPAMQETRVQSLGWGNPLENGMATHSNMLAWKIPGAKVKTNELLTLSLHFHIYMTIWYEYMYSQFTLSVLSDSLQPHGLQNARLPCPSQTSRASSNSCSLTWWCHLTISSSIIPFSSRLQSFPASESFLSYFFASGG